MNEISLRQTSWGLRGWIGVVGFIFILQLVFIFWLGERPRIRTQSAGNPFVWRKAGPAWDEIIALHDPTLFLLPHLQGFSGQAWMRTPGLPAASFFWTEPPRLLTLSDRELGHTFNRFVATNNWRPFRTLQFPDPTINLPEPTKRVVLPAASSLRIEGPLATRSLATKPQLRSWSHSDILTNSVVQLVIDEQGRPVTPGTLLVSSGLPDADRYALEQVRMTRFNPLKESVTNSPANGLTWGLLIFEWALTNNAPVQAPRP
jgi:hypothetical protein